MSDGARQPSVVPEKKGDSLPETVVAKDQWGQIIYYDQWNSLELRWFESTTTGAESDLRSTMQTFAQEAVNRSPTTLIVDTTDFRHTWGDDMRQWRDAEIIPLYNQAGVTKFAFIANPQYPGPTVEAGATPAPDGPANFPTGWFKTREAAYQWLAA
jgi:hypothetical protein